MLIVLISGCTTTGVGKINDVTDSEISTQDVILAEIDGQPLTLQEFEREYAKTIGNETASKSHSSEEYTDFLRRLVNYRVKLREAEIAGYFEDEELISEINGYRASFAKPYLLDTEIVEPIVKDLYEKRKEYVHVSHIMINLPRDNPSPSDTLTAWNKISALQDSLRQGIPFGDLAFRRSEDLAASSPTSRNGYRGDLGFFTGGDMIQSFETAAYNTPLGEVSGIVRSPFGYHILKVHDRESTKPDYFASHIMIRFLGETPDDSVSAYAKMDSLKTLIDGGMSFAEVAKEYSDDRRSAEYGGSLQTWIPYRMENLDQTFHDNLFAMDTLGQVSDVVESRFGLHLIKLDDIAPEKTYEQQYDDLERVAQGLPRIRTAETALAKSSRELYTSSIDTLRLTRLIGGVQLDSLQTYLQQLAGIDSVGSMPLITLQDSIYTLKEFANFVPTQSISLNPGLSTTENALRYADAFLDDRVLFYRSFELEHTDEGFKEIMQNFRDGLAIFEIMEDSIWNASSEDTLRLVQHYEANLEQYQWPDRHRLIELSGLSDSLLAEAMNLLELGTRWTDLEHKIATDSTWNLQLDTVIVSDSTGSIYDEALGLANGEHTEILSARNRKLVLYMDGIEPARPKTFEEAKTDVMAEIQVLLEQEFHQRLRSKYRVRTFPDRLQMAFGQ